MRIIIVDDEAIIRAGLEKILLKMSLNIHVIGSYSNGLDALKHIESLEDAELDVLITDIKMSKMDGLQLIEAVTHRSFTKLVFSGFSEFEYARKAMRGGVQEYLLKPIDKQQLYQVLHTVYTKKQHEAGLKKLGDESDQQSHYAIHRVKEILYIRYKEQFELDDIANRVGMSSHYISRLFKQLTGMTMTDYLIAIRIERAKSLLLDTPHLKNYEIAQLVGYSDGVYFQKLFKKVTGMTPKEYRDSRV